MKITAVSISYRSAPLEIREKAAFTKKAQKILLKSITENIADEAAVLSTCNRSEIYTVSNRDIKNELFNIFNEKANADISQHLDVYEDICAIEHLFNTAAGLDSMIIGEDQILGQVKESYEQALESGGAKTVLNLVFRFAITAAKRVKTDTMLSKTPVSAATVAVKVCEEYTQINGKCALIIGASGKTGSVVLKNLKSKGDIKVYATYGRNKEDISGCKMIPYDRRYDYIDRSDIIISATSSPHFVLTDEKIKESIHSDKKRIFIDLAVPKDIDFMPFGQARLINIDGLERICRENNQKKLAETEKARVIMKKYINELENRLIYNEYCDRINMDMKKVFHARDTLSPDAFFEYVKEICR